MKSIRLLFSFTALFFTISSVSAQGAYIISGKIHDTSNTQILSGATVKIKGTNFTTATKEDGSFEIKAFQKLPITLVVSYVGYVTQEFYHQRQYFKIIVWFVRSKPICGPSSCVRIQGGRKYFKIACNHRKAGH